MYTIPILSEAHQTAINYYDKKFSKHIPWAGFSAAAGSFLLLTAIITIFAVCMCLNLPSINVIQHIILPGVLPGVLAILASLPFFVATFLLQRRMTRIRNDWLKTYEDIFADPTYNYADLSEKKRAKFIAEHLIPKGWNKDYKERILTDLKNRLPKEKVRTPSEKKLAKDFDNAKKRLHKTKKKSSS